MALVKRLKREKREKENEIRRLNKVARQRRQLSMRQQKIPILKTLHPDKRKKAKNKNKKRKITFEELALLSARSSPSRISRVSARNGESGMENSVLLRAMRESKMRTEPRSVPTSPTDDNDERRMYLAPSLGRHKMPTFDENGADSLIDAVDEHQQEGKDEYYNSDHDDVIDEEEASVVDTLPMRRNNESVDDYIARATKMLEQQALDEM